MIKLFIFLTLLSCGKKEIFGDFVKEETLRSETYYSGIEPEFKEIIKDFELDYYLATGKELKVNYPVNFGTMTGVSSEAVGVCYHKPREVVIRKSFWEDPTVSYCQKIQLIYHELGHCSLGRGHKDEKIQGKPLSAMNTYMLPDDLFCDFNEDYITEMMTGDHSHLEEEFSKYLR